MEAGHSPCGSVDWNCSESRKIKHFIVTPLVGVWIEIVTGIHPVSSCFGHSPCGSVDWNYIVNHPHQFPTVTPLVGVWIEIPRGVCGCDAHGVTPLAGVWIEIANEQTAFLIRFCHSPCGSVDWNTDCITRNWHVNSSLPLRECGLKSIIYMSAHAHVIVTPLAGVWIEIHQCERCRLPELRHSPCGSVDWNKQMHRNVTGVVGSLPLRECGLKYAVDHNKLQLLLRHSPCGSVDWNN